MTFHIYDEHGHEHEYDPDKDWRHFADIKSASVHETPDSLSKRPMLDFPILDLEDVPKKSKKRSVLISQEDPFSARGVLKAYQIMHQPVITLMANSPLLKACIMFNESRYRHIPIVTKGNKIVGILSDRGVAWDMIAKNRTMKTEKRCVGDVMIRNVLCASSNTPISDIARVFIEERIGCMPIVDDKDILKGVLTRSDILRTLIKIHPRDFRA